MRKGYLKNFIALLLTLTMLVQVIQLPVFAQEAGISDQSASAGELLVLPDEYEDGVHTERTDIKSVIVGEDNSLREENVKHFRCEDGSYIAASYPYPVHYEVDGEWEDIDNTLTPAPQVMAAPDENGEANASTADLPAYINTSAPFSTGFPDKLSGDTSISIEAGGIPMQIGMLCNTSQSGILPPVAPESRSAGNTTDVEAINDSFLRLDKATSKIIYPGAYPNTDIEYIVTPNRIKENIIIKSAQASYSYEYLIKKNGLTLILNSDNSVSAYDAGNTLVYIIESPYMFDSAEEESTAVTVTLTDEEDGYHLTYTPDAQWINAPEREFPVTVDPSILVQPLSTEIYDCTVNSKITAPEPYYQFLSAGYNSYGKQRTYLKFKLPALPDCSVVNNAECALAFQGYDTNGVGGNVYMCAYEVGRDWSTGSKTDPSTQPGLTWELQKDWTFGPVLDYKLYKQYSAGEYVTWNITSAVKKWYEQGINTGITIQSNKEGQLDASGKEIKRNMSFYSSDKNDYVSQPYPLFSVYYMNNAGLEGYWTYHSIDSGRSGQTSINDYNGELVHIHSDISMSGNRLPVSISHVYNLDKTNSSGIYGGMKLGDGWRLNLNEQIIPLTSSDPTYKQNYRFKYIDEDGTVKYFKTTSKSTEFAYEFNDKLILTKNAGSTAARYTLKDETGNQSVYNSSGYLVKVQDTNENIQTITYSNNRISKITDPVGRAVTFQYNADGQLTSIKDPSNRATSYEYQDGKLIKITYPDGKTTRFEYANGNLTKIIGIDGAYAEFGYKAVTVPGKTSYRTQNAKFYGTQGGLQDSYTYTFSPSSTKVEDNFGHSETMLFDSAGRTVCVTDENGRAFYGDYNKTGNQNNTLKYQSDMQQTITNLVKNSGAEAGNETSWYWNGLTGSVGNFRIDTAEKYHGLYSFKVYSDNGIRINYRQDLTIVPGKTYTLSALVKTNGTLPGNGGAFLGLVHQDANGNVSYEKSEIIKSTEGWERYSVSFTYPSDYSTTASIMLGLEDSQYGICWFDDVQLEEGAVANRYNMADNGSMEATNNSVPSGWATENPGSGDSITAGRTGNGYTITGDPDKVKSLYQDRAMDGKKGDTIVAGAWAKSNSVLATPEGGGTTSTTPPKDDKKCMLSVTVTYKAVPEGKTSKEVTDRFEFPSMSPDWQYLSKSVTALGDYEKVRFALEYRYNMNTVTFDDADLYVDTYGTKYEYDASGKITSEKDSAGQEYKYTYDGPDLTKVEFNKDGVKKDETNYTYDSKHNLIKEVSDAGVITEYTYGENGAKTYGNVTKTIIKNTDGTLKTGATCEYTSDYNYQTKITDAQGKTIEYDYDTVKGLLNWSRDANGAMTFYLYDPDTDVITAKSGSKAEDTDVANVFNEFGYNNDVVQTITGKELSYNFSQDQFGRESETKVGNQVLITNEYNANGTQSKLSYGNGDTEESVYNSLDRVVADKYNGDIKYEWQYGSKGQIGKYIDHVNDVDYRYEYDLVDRLRIVYGSDGTRLRNLYDDKGNIYNTLYTFNKNTYIKAFSNNYIYGQDNRITQVHFNQNNLDLNRTYDGLGRVTNRRFQQGTNDAFINTDYTFVEGTGGNTTGLVSSISNNGNTLSYTYDNKGNILTVSENGLEKVKYAYDGLNELTREDNSYAGKSYTYDYDDGGNIVEVKEYAYTTGTLGTPTKTTPYVYGDTNWRDKLTTFDGQTITYDEIGNPLTFSGNTMAWTGRQLDSITGNSNTASYKYNSDGIRTEKSVNGAITKYYLQGERIILEKDANEERTFWYDGDGKPAVFNVYSAATNGAAVNYYYMYNAQGDVIGLYDNAGNVVCRYYYDAWGKLLKITDGTGNDKTNDTAFIGYKNPIRYRAYYYDNESGMYYLQSRYYNPDLKRFINADDPDVLTEQTDLLGLNLFAYCTNDPVNNCDDAGYWKLPNWAKVAIGAAVIVAAAAVTVATAGTGTAVACFAVGALKGAVAGAAIGAASGAVTGAVSHRITTGSWKGAGKAAADGAADGFMKGSILGFLTGGIGSSACFVAGTAVLTSAGLVAIENIRAGDTVWAENPETGDKSLKQVVRTFDNQTSELVHVFVNGEEIITTPEHPFYVPQKGWTGSIELRAGDTLVLSNGNYVIVEKIQHEVLEAPIHVYNFEVQDFHTYYVGEQSVLVHNLCGKVHGNSLKTTKKTDLYVLRDQNTNIVKKIGETTRGVKRYTQKYYTRNNVYYQKIAEGTKRAMHYQQHRLLTTFVSKVGRLPYLNKSLW